MSAVLSAFALVGTAALVGWLLLGAVSILTRPLLRLLPDFLAALTIVGGGAVLTVARVPSLTLRSRPMTRSISTTILVLEEFRKLNPELPIQIALVLMLIARKPGISFRELVQLTGLSKSSVSRHVDALSKERGYGLVTSREDPIDRRNKVARLTPQGEASSACFSSSSVYCSAGRRS